MKQGEFCSLTRHDDAYVYYIESIVGFRANLVYVERKEDCRTSCDKDSLRKPTEAQLNHEYNEATIQRFK